MKKLFLYLIFYVLLFVSAYTVFFDFAKGDMEGKSIHGTDSEDNSGNDGDKDIGDGGKNQAEGETPERLNNA